MEMAVLLLAGLAVGLAAVAGDSPGLAGKPSVLPPERLGGKDRVLAFLSTGN